MPSPLSVEWQEKNIPILMDKGILVPALSPWCAKTQFPRKANGALRMVHTFVSMNHMTIKDKYPMPRIGYLLLWTTFSLPG